MDAWFGAKSQCRCPAGQRSADHAAVRVGGVSGSRAAGGSGPAAGWLRAGAGDRGEVGRGEAQVFAEEGARDRPSCGFAAQPRLRDGQQLRRFGRGAQQPPVDRLAGSTGVGGGGRSVLGAVAGCRRSGRAGRAVRGRRPARLGRPDRSELSRLPVDRPRRCRRWVRTRVVWSAGSCRARAGLRVDHRGPGRRLRWKTMTSSWAMRCRGRPRSRWLRMKSRWKNEPRATKPPWSVTRPSRATHRSTGVRPAWRPQAGSGRAGRSARRVPARAGR